MGLVGCSKKGKKKKKKKKIRVCHLALTKYPIACYLTVEDVISHVWQLPLRSSNLLGSTSI